MYKVILNISRKFWPQLDILPLSRQMVAVGDVFTSIYCFVLFLIGIIWLILETNFDLILSNIPLLIVFILFTIFFNIYTYFIIIEFRKNRYGSADGAFDSMMIWAACLLFGPAALWIIITISLVRYFLASEKRGTTTARWDQLRHLLLTLSGFTVPFLIGLKVYELLASPQAYPIPSLDIKYLLAGISGIIVNFIVFVIIWIPTYIYALNTQRIITQKKDHSPLTRFFILALSLPTLAHPFAILAAGLYSQNGFYVFLLLISGFMIIALFARTFSNISESNRQKSKHLEKLEVLGRKLVDEVEGSTGIKEVLAEHLPNLFQSSRLAIWLKSGHLLYKDPPDWEPYLEDIIAHVSKIEEPEGYLRKDTLPWDIHNKLHNPIISSPIFSEDKQELLGGIYIELKQLIQPWNRAALNNMFPAVNTFCSQIAGYFRRAREFANDLAYKRVDQEIQIAAEIQASFFPSQLPIIPGFQLAVSLTPAGDLSGDFFDFIELPDGLLGITVADVADKGMGAALYMALGRTLIRNYALVYPERPHLVLENTNTRLLADASANLFITCFYAVLDPKTGTINYSNAGHHPPFLVSTWSDSILLELERTGMPIGVDEEAIWQTGSIQLAPGDKLVMYSDGATDAENAEGEFFGYRNFRDVILESKNGNAFELQTKILERIQGFSNAVRQSDDLTLMVIAREEQENDPVAD